MNSIPQTGPFGQEKSAQNTAEGFVLPTVKETMATTYERSYMASEGESKSIKAQIREHLDELNAMDVVASVEGTVSIGLSKEMVRRNIVEQLKSTGFRVDRQGFGVIQFEEGEINNSLNYIQTDAEKAAYQALRRVLKRGKIIESRDKHKGREYGTVTIAAKIEINGVPAIMAAVVKKTKGNRYKVHRVLTPEGEDFTMASMKNAEPTTGGGLVQKDTHARPISSASVEAQFPLVAQRPGAQSAGGVNASNNSIPQTVPFSQENSAQNPSEGNVLPTAKELDRQRRAEKAETEGRILAY